VKTGIIVFAHGSTVAAANEAVRAVTAELARRGGYDRVRTAFLDCAPPDLAAAVADLAGAGVDRIVVLPYFLTFGSHIGQDLPRIVERLSIIHKGVRIEVTPPLDGHPALVEILIDRAREARA
jgi:sirohydrochlorin cobaltochelatase